MFCVIIPPEEKLEDPESSFFYSYRQNRLGRIKNFIWFCVFWFLWVLWVFWFLWVWVVI